MPRISIKALVLSNIAHWIFFGVGWTVVDLLFFAYATVTADGTPNLSAALEQIKSSPAFLVPSSLVFVIAAIAAGYIAARIAPRDKLMHGALSTVAWVVCAFCLAIWGGETDDAARMPHWLDVVITYGVPLAGVLGAYIWQLRARHHARAAMEVEEMAPAATSLASVLPRPASLASQGNEGPGTTSPATKKLRVRGRAGTGLGVFLFLLMQFLLTKHEQYIVFVASVVAIALFIGFAFVSKALKSQGTSA